MKMIKQVENEIKRRGNYEKMCRLPEGKVKIIRKVEKKTNKRGKMKINKSGEKFFFFKLLTFYHTYNISLFL